MSEPNQHNGRLPLVEGLVGSLQWNDDDRLPASGSYAEGERSLVDLSQRLSGALKSAQTSSHGGPFAELRSEDAIREAFVGGRPAGPFESQIVAIKEMVAVEGLHRRAGSAALKDIPASKSDAAITTQLRKGGAVIMGSTAMHELAFGTTGVNHAVGSPQHPQDPTRVCGGSSSGSACAVAKGLVDFAIGTDTGGSVRIPSALCGVVGFKPAFDSYSTLGVKPLSPTLDHVGVHARTVSDVIAVHQGLTGEQPSEEVLRIGVARQQIEELHGEVREAINWALEAITGCAIELHDVELIDSARAFTVSTAILFVEAFNVNRHLIEKRASEMGNDVVERFAAGEQIPGYTYVNALASRRHIQDATSRILSEVDVVIGPTVPIVAPTFDEVSANPSLGGELVRTTRLANITGLPAITIPIPTRGLPVGVQIMSTTNARTLSAARLIEQYLDA